MKKALVTALENAFKTKAEEKEKKRFLAHCLSIELKNFLELRGKKLLNTRNSDELNRSTEDWIEEPHTVF